MDRTFALIRRMRDALGNPEPFDYVFTPARMDDMQKTSIHPQLEGGIGALLKLQDEWQLLEQLDKAITKDMTDDQKQKTYESIMRIGPQHHLLVRSPVQGSPAASVLKSDDAIIAVDGQSLDGMTQEDAIKHITGALGTDVHLTIERVNSHGVKVQLTFTLLRSQIQQHALFVDDKDGIRHITIVNFENDYLLGDFYQALVDAKSKGIKGIVIDVRGNPGGRLDYVKGMLEMLVNRGEILMTRQRDPGTDQVIQTEFVMDGPAAITEQMLAGAAQDTKKFGIVKREEFSADYAQSAMRDPEYVDEHPLAAVIDDDMPVVVLENNNSYSASEIFAGGVAGAHRGQVIGQPSAGKDDIMTQLPLPECQTPGPDKKCSRAGLAVISGLFYPGGKDTDLTGVIPNRIVEQAKDFGKTDAQLDAAYAAINEAAAALTARDEAAAKSKTGNSDRFKQRIKERNDNDLLPVDKQNPDLQQ